MGVRSAKLKHWIEEYSRRLKPFLVARQLLHRRQLAGVGDHYRELGVGKRWYSLVSHAEVAGRGDGAARLDRADGLEELQADPRFVNLPEAVQDGLTAWPERGYLVVEGLIDRARVEAINDDIDRLSGAGSIRAHHRSARFMNAHEQSPNARAAVSEPRLLELLELILGRPAGLFQTISFVRGSQQAAHSDAFHMMTEPPGFLVGVWIALEDIDADSGPVFYLPGSHRLPYVMSEDLDLAEPPPLLTRDKGRAYVQKMREVVASAPTEPTPFTARAGDVLFWHHNLLHGGSAIGRAESTRRSLVAHYFAKDVLCYHEVTERPALIPTAPFG